MSFLLRQGARSLAVVLLATGLVLVASTLVWGHALLQASSPEEGENLPQLPSKVLLSFYEEVSAPAYVVLNAPDGTNLASGEAEVDGLLISQQVEATDQQGTFIMAYRAVSEDGHPITGQVTFSVGEINTLAALKARASNDSPSAVQGLAQTLRSFAAWTGEQRNMLIGVGLFAMSGTLYWFSRPAREPSD